MVGINEDPTPVAAGGGPVSMDWLRGAADYHLGGGGGFLGLGC